MSIRSKLGKSVVALAVTGASALGMTGTASAVTGAPYLGFGYTTSGDGVWCVQHSMNYYMAIQDVWQGPYGQIAEDSKWGPQTEATVRSFQRFAQVDPDGVVGPMTGRFLLGGGDPRYNGTKEAPRYCYWKMPGERT